MGIFKNLRERILGKSVVAFVGLNFLTTLFAPAVMALTSGPSAPEYTSFEPVEASNMVNMATGDFTYNLPILEVPGPEGGFPMSLSYHAGIMPDEEASWVGLGWTLNPGAISRSVNGFADDFNGVEGSTWDYWHGGETSVYSWGLSLSIGYASVNLGKTDVYDTYQGQGYGLNLGASLGYKIGDHEVASVGFQLSTLPYGGYVFGLSTGFGIGTGVGGHKGGQIGASANLSLGLNFYSNGDVKGTTSLGGGLSYSKNMSVSNNTSTGYRGRASIIGFSIDSDGGARASTGLKISSSQSNRNAGKISSRTSSKGFVIPLFLVNFSYSESHTRYWSSEGAYNRLNGILYYPDQISNELDAFDTHHLPDLDNKASKPANETDGGMLPSYDSYMVLGQGMGGSIRPQLYEPAQLFSQESGEVTYTNGTAPNNKIEFGFVNEFSSYFKTNDNTTSLNASDISGLIDLLDDDEEFNNQAFIGSTSRRIGAKNVEWYTVKDIRENTAKGSGFIKSNIFGAYRDIVYSRNVDDQIGGFSVTNASGVTYHYGLPVYAFNQFTKSQKGEDYQSKTETHPYAYTWLLTAITGPDFVDMDDNGLVGEADYGYWVEFDYGNWSKSYGWRNPSEFNTFHKDIDTDVKVYSRGEKELYYLDYIRTRSHTAIFEKEIRNDAKGVSDLDKGGFVPNQTRLGPEKYDYIQDSESDEFAFRYPTASLRLNRILLMKNDKLDELISDAGLNSINGLKTLNNHPVLNKKYQGYFQYCSTIGLITICKDPELFEYKQREMHFWDNVITIQDLDNIDLTKNSLSSVEFDNDHYDLCNLTPNSFSSAETYVENLDVENLTKTGKLTLNAIQVKGEGGEKLVPSIDFGYDLANHNPDYAYSSGDMWGFYNESFEGDGREPIGISLDTKDQAIAWSLNSISTPFGSTINIEYESDSYVRSAYDKLIGGKEYLEILNIDYENYGTYGFYPWVEIDPSKLKKPLHQIYQVGDEVIFSSVSNGLTSPNGAYYNYDVNLDFSATIIEFDGNSKMKLQPQMNGSLGYPGYNVPPNGYVQPISFHSGVLILDRLEGESYGGGLRTKSVKMTVNEDMEYVTNYSYDNGVTGYIPNEHVLNIHPELKEYLVAQKNLSALTYYSMLGLTPGVIYEKVTMTESSDIGGVHTDYPGSIEYTFRTPSLTEGLPNVEPSEIMMSVGTSETTKYKKHTILNTGVGQLLRVRKYDNSIPKQVLTETTNTYLEDLPDVNSLADYKNKLNSLYEGQGRTDQLYYNEKTVGANDTRFVVTEVENLPSVLVSTSSKDNKTKVSSSTTNLAYDLITGSAIKTLSTDAQGKYYVSVEKSAYHFETGMKPLALGGNNMLIQGGLSYSYQVDNETDLNPVGLVAANVSYWATDIPNTMELVIDKYMEKYNKSYIGISTQGLLSNGLYNYPFDGMNDQDIYNDALANDEDDWFKSGEATLVTVDAKVLEYEDINSDKHSVLYDPTEGNVIASGTFANHEEIAFNSFEYGDLSEGTADYTSGVVKIGRSHSGTAALEIPINTVGFRLTIPQSKLEAGRNYHASVWVYSFSSAPPNLANLKLKSIDGAEEQIAIASAAKKSNGWYLVELEVQASGNSDLELILENEGSNRSFFVDDFRFHPLDGNFTSYVYDKNTNRLNYILDKDNLYTEFEYDESGRLKRTWKERMGFSTAQLLNESFYNYGNE